MLNGYFRRTITTAYQTAAFVARVFLSNKMFSIADETHEVWIVVG